MRCLRRFTPASGLVALAVLAIIAVAEAQQAARVPRIGYLLLGPLTEKPSPERAALLDGLRELGYVVGQSVSIEYRSASLRPEFLPDLVDELIQLKVDVIVAVDTRAVQAAQGRTRSIPIVFPAIGDPVGTGVVDSLARPGGNTTGQAFMSPELGGKRLALLKEAMPRVSRIAVLWNPTNPGVTREWKESQAAARALGVRLLPFELRSVQDLDAALGAIARERPDALITLADPLTTSLRVLIVEFAAKHRLPAMYGFREFAETGGLMYYGADLSHSYRRAAAQVDRILKGARPGDLPVEQPTKFELIVNMKTAKALRLSLPPAFLLRADRVIE